MRLFFAYAKSILGVALIMVGLNNPTIAGVSISVIVCAITGMCLSISGANEATEIELGRG